MIPGLVGRWLAAGELDLALPGSGQTAQRWHRLVELTSADVVAGRLAEAHTDAIAILAELRGPDPKPGQLWGVWAAESPDAVLRVHSDGDGTMLDGTKGWCSGAGICTHALVTARIETDGGSDGRGLFAVDLSDPHVHPLPSNWRNPGMAASDTRSVQFHGAPAVAVGAPGDYLDRPGFWHGAIGVSACWLGGARAVAAPLYERAGRDSADAHTLAHLGAVDAALAAAEATLVSAACQVDADPSNREGRAELIARRTRAVVETAVDEAITRTGRALGPGPLAQDARHAARVADLTIYVRQSHAERDLAELGRLAGRHR
jgi:alkylation response protein AidB-like acyl-CoA dehydrogenase